MAATGRVRQAILADIPYLPAVEASAAALFRTIPELAYFADDPSHTPEELAQLCVDGTLWVAEEADNSEKPCAFIACRKVDDSIYIAELSVHSDFQRRGLAGLLIRAAATYSASIGLKKVSLVTERDVPWNGPMYFRRGFREVERSALGPEHIKIIEHEKEMGMDISRRVLMVLEVAEDDISSPA